MNIFSWRRMCDQTDIVTTSNPYGTLRTEDIEDSDVEDKTLRTGDIEDRRL